MRITLQVHVGYPDSVDEREIEVEVPEPATLADLWQALYKQHADLLEMPLYVLDASAREGDPLAHPIYQSRPFVRGAALTLLGRKEEEGDMESAAADPRGAEVGAPLADGFDFPVGKPDGRGYYIAAGLAEQPYYKRFGMWHTGEDWNRVTGGDSDLGAPVYATANGRVVNAGHYVPSWGNILLLEHRLPGGKKVWSQYAHLREFFVRPGQFVRRGQVIGTIGKGANNMWPAHLHFEIRVVDMPPNQWGWSSRADRVTVLRNYVHPSDFIRSHRPGGTPPGLVVDDEEAGFVRTASPYWFEAKLGYEEHCFWTWAVDDQLGEDCVGIWRPSLPVSGLYEVFAFIPRDFATTRRAPYQITHRRGQSLVTIDQSEYFDEWVSLGTYPFSTEQPAQVRLSDLTGEPFTREEAGRRKIAYDAVMWVRVDRRDKDE